MDNEEKQSGRERWEEYMREMDEARRGGEEAGGEERWRGRGERRGEGWGAKQSKNRIKHTSKL